MSEGSTNRLWRGVYELAEMLEGIERNLGDLAETYDDVVPRLFSDAPTYQEAANIVWPRIKSLVP